MTLGTMLKYAGAFLIGMLRAIPSAIKGLLTKRSK